MAAQGDLRASGNKARHDETVAFQTTLAAAPHTTARSGGFVPDWYAFTLAFKGVVLEGLEVVFIALTFGSNQHNIALAALAALAAVLVVAAVGLGAGLVRRYRGSRRTA